MLERMVERIRRARSIDGVVLATTDLAEDDALAHWAESQDIGCFRGSASDVLGRLRGAVDDFAMDVVVEMLGDNPLVHSALIDAALDRYAKGDVDYVATLTDEYPKAPPGLRRFPIGVRVQVFGADTIRRCADLASASQNREHATSFIAQHPEIFRTAFVEASGQFAVANRPELTFAVNHPDNLDLIRAVFARCYRGNPDFSVADAIATFDATPDLRPLMGEPRA